MFAVAENLLIKDLHRSGFISWSDKPFTLKSGGTSHVYVNGRSDLTRDPQLLRDLGGVVERTAKSVFHDLRTPEQERPCLIGIPTAGTPLAVASGLPVSIMREKPKNYGNSSGWIEGSPDPKYFFMTIDNVITDGQSKRETIERLAVDGYPVEKMVHLILVDRGQGGVEALRKDGLQVEVIFNLIDIVRAFGEHSLWTPQRVAAAEEELARSPA